MDLIDRYLAAVKRELPEAQREDVAAELRDLLLSETEEKEAALGRPLTEGELEAVLAGFGHPLMVAGRYRKVQHLIGPEMFPFWWFALKTTFATVGGIYLVLLILRFMLTEDGSRTLERVAPSIWSGGMFTFAAVTLACVGLEQLGLTRFMTRWRARDLPPAGAAPRSRFELSTEIAMMAVFILWWVGAIEFSSILRFDRQPSVEMIPLWSLLYWPILAYAVAALAVSLLEFLRPVWVRMNAILGLVKDLGFLAIVAILARSGPWVTAVGGPDLADNERVAKVVNLGIEFGLMIALVVCLVGMGRSLWRLARSARGDGVSGPSRPGVPGARIWRR